MGRPLQPPRIEPLPCGSFFVTGSVGGAQKKGTFPTLDAARKFAEEICQARASALNFFATRLSVDQLRQAESAWQICERRGISLLDAALFASANYRDTSKALVVDVIAQFRQEREIKRTTANQIDNVANAAEAFFESVRRDTLGTPTRAEVVAWLKGKTPGAYRQLRSDLSGFLNWCVSAEHLTDNPARRTPPPPKGKKKDPATIFPETFAALMLDLEHNAPEWIPHAVLCGLAGMRPDIRDGEAARLDASLRKGVPFYLSGLDGVFELDGKAHGIRAVKVDAFGPLRDWLQVYPLKGALFPEATARAERDWSAIKKRHGITVPDVLRHTAASALVFSGLNLAQVAMLLGTSEKELRSSYVNPRWTEDMTKQLWSVRPTRCLGQGQASA